MENDKTLVRKRTRIAHKVDLSLIRAALLNRLEAACRNSRDPVRVLSIGGNIYIEDGQIVVHMNIEMSRNPTRFLSTLNKLVCYVTRSRIG